MSLYGMTNRAFMTQHTWRGCRNFDPKAQPTKTRATSFRPSASLAPTTGCRTATATPACRTALQRRARPLRQQPADRRRRRLRRRCARLWYGIFGGAANRPGRLRSPWASAGAATWAVRHAIRGTGPEPPGGGGEYGERRPAGPAGGGAGEGWEAAGGELSELFFVHTSICCGSISASLCPRRIRAPV